MEYFEKIDKNPYEDLYWNLPEQKQNTVNIIGGNIQNFRTVIKTAEYLAENYPIATVNITLPDILKSKLPPFDNINFLPSTEAGSFNGENLSETISAADFSLLIGDLSKNTITGKAITSACATSAKPILITRDAVDLLAENSPEKALFNDHLIIFGSLVQIQKILRSVYYPKMLLLSQSLIQVAETLHKFTLSYPLSIITFHNSQLLIVKNGIVKTVPLEKSNCSAITLWDGRLAAKIAALNIYNPNDFIRATIAAIYHKNNTTAK